MGVKWPRMSAKHKDCRSKTTKDMSTKLAWSAIISKQHICHILFYYHNNLFLLRSRSKVKVKFSLKWVKKQRTGHISVAISPSDFIHGTKVQPNKAHSMTQVSMILTLGQGQGQRSSSKFSQNGLNTKQLATSLMLFHPQTSSYILSQLFVTHLGVALLFFREFEYLASNFS